jgi:hypothetical protein
MPNSSSKQPHKPRTVLILSFMLWLLPLTSPGQQANPSGDFSTSPISTARILLHQLYPDLDDKGYIAEIELSAPFDRAWTSTPEFSFIISRRSASFGRPPSPPVGAQTVIKSEHVVQALFGFDSVGIIEDLHIHSAEVVFDTKQDEIRKLVDSHRSWSDAQVEAALKKAGAQFGPSDQEAFSKHLPRKELEMLLGDFKVDSTEFRLRHQQPSGSLAELYWEVNVSSTVRDGRLLHWSLTFEPFTGKVISIVRYLADR